MSDDDTPIIIFTVRLSARFLRRLAAVQKQLDRGICGSIDPTGSAQTRSGMSRSVILRAAAQRGLTLLETELGIAEANGVSE